jgi:hypothetical protein
LALAGLVKLLEILISSLPLLALLFGLLVAAASARFTKSERGAVVTFVLRGCRVENPLLGGALVVVMAAVGVLIPIVTRFSGTTLDGFLAVFPPLLLILLLLLLSTLALPRRFLGLLRTDAEEDLLLPGLPVVERVFAEAG